MRLLVQRVQRAAVTVEGAPVAAIGPGLLALVGFGGQDSATMVQSRVWSGMVDKLLHTRLFPGATPDKAHKMDRDVMDFGGEVLLVSQFTLYADCRHGRRPGFQDAAPPALAASLFDHFVQDVTARLTQPVGSGIFGAYMEVDLINWGPVTLLLDSAVLFPASGAY